MTSSSYPAWMSMLSTASIAADLQAADVNGVVSYSGLVTLLTDLDATLSSGSKLAAAEYSDLKTIAGNLNNGVSTPACLTYVFNALVNGNAANATWTGGAASSSSLGDLAAGTNATQLSELVGKWLLGSDLPSSSVQISGVPDFNITYSSLNSPLFGAGGPTVNDINQGELGNCYFLAPCAELAAQAPSAVNSMFTNLGNGIYDVRFYVDGQAEYVTVNSELANGGTVFNGASDIWGSLAEKAWAQFQASGIETGNIFENSGNSYTTIGNGGSAAYAMEALTGASVITDYLAVGASWSSYTLNDALAGTSLTSDLSTSWLFTTIVKAIAAKDDVVLSSFTNAVDSSGKATLVANHAMSVYGYDSATQSLEIRNPWGTKAGQYWDTTFEISLSSLLSDGDMITIDNAGDSSPFVGAISETAAYLAANFDTINASRALTAITVTDPGMPVLHLTANQAANDTVALGAITNSLFELVTESSSTLCVQAPSYFLAETDSNAAVSLNGSADSLNMSGSSEWATLNGSSEAIWAYGTAEWITLNGTTEWATLNASSQATYAYGNLEYITLNGSTEWATLNGLNDAVWANGSAEYVTLNGSAEWATLGGSSEAIWTNGSAEYVTLTGSAEWATLNGSNESVWAYGNTEYLTLNGSTEWATLGSSNEAIWANASAEYVTLNGSSEWATLGGSKEAVWSNGSDEYVYLNGSSQWATLGGSNEAIWANGSDEYVTLNGSSEWATLSGSNESIWANGSSEYLTLSGSSESATLSGSNEFVWAFQSSESIALAGSSNTATIYGPGDSVTISGTSDSVNIAGSNESLIFSKVLGQDVVTGFNASTEIQLSGSEFATWNALLSHVSQSGFDTTITLDASDKVTLKNVTASTLVPSNFHFA